MINITHNFNIIYLLLLLEDVSDVFEPSRPNKHVDYLILNDLQLSGLAF